MHQSMRMQYNTLFWAMVQQGGLTTAEAHAALKVSG
jgi:hypothetical protein